jgi:hypothetical protein
MAYRVLDKNQIDVVVNFIIRLLLSISNVDVMSKEVIKRTDECFRRLLRR